MKKILYVLLDLLSVAFLIGGYVIQYFTKKKLGMVRWVTYKNSKFQDMMPVDILKYAAAAIVFLLALLVIREFMKKRSYMGKADMVMLMVMAVLALLYLGFTVFISADTVRSYYLVMPMIGAAALLQVIRNMAAVWTCGNEK